MKVAVGSQNPVKITAVKNAFLKAWDTVDVTGIDVNPGISHMPTNSEEALIGATTRARTALKKAKADYGVGLEGYALDTSHGMFLSGMVVIVNKKGVRGIGSGYTMPLPDIVARQIRKGAELGPVMDKLLGDVNTKQKYGAIGALTKGLMTRTSAFEAAVIYALAPFLNPELYGAAKYK